MTCKEICGKSLYRRALQTDASVTLKLRKKSCVCVQKTGEREISFLAAFFSYD